MRTFTKYCKLWVLLPLSYFVFVIESCKKNDALTTATPEEIVTQVVSNGYRFPHTKQFPADVATRWFHLLTDITRSRPYIPAQSFPFFAYSGLALYESVLPGMPSYQSIYKHFTGITIEFDNSKEYYWPACANAAIARITTRIMQNYSTPNLAPVLSLEASLNASFQSIVTVEQLQASNEFGRYVADKIYELRKMDGDLNPDGSLTTCPPYIPLGNTWNWVPTPPNYSPAIGACRGDMRTLIPNIVTTAFAPPHLGFSTDPSSAFYQAANEVYQSRNNITPDQTMRVNNWSSVSGSYNLFAHSMKIVTDIVKKEQLNLEDAATLYAKVSIAMYDAIHAVFKSQFHYALLRPVTYIRNYMDNNTWNAINSTPIHPSYPDETVCPIVAIMTVLENNFGSSYTLTDSTNKTSCGEWSYSSLNELVTDVVQGRVNGGTNFRFAAEAGAVQGRTVGELVNTLPLKKP